MGRGAQEDRSRDGANIMTAATAPHPDCKSACCSGDYEVDLRLYSTRLRRLRSFVADLPHTLTWTDEEYARELIRDINYDAIFFALTPSQERHLNLWFTRTEDPLPPERRAPIIAAYAALIERFEREVPEP